MVEAEKNQKKKRKKKNVPTEGIHRGRTSERKEAGSSPPILSRSDPEDARKEEVILEKNDEGGRNRVRKGRPCQGEKTIREGKKVARPKGGGHGQKTLYRTEIASLRKRRRRKGHRCSDRPTEKTN